MIEWIKYIGEFSGWLNALIAFFLLLISWKSGFLRFLLELKNGNGGVETKRNSEDIEQLYKHADIANKEMGEIKQHIGDMKIDIRETKTDIRWMRKILEKNE